MTIKQTHDIILDLMEKSVGDYKSHEQIDDALHMAQLDKFVELHGNPKTFQPGRPVPLIGYGQNDKIHADLRNFKVTVSLIPGNTASGQWSLPAGFLYPISCWLVYQDAASRNRYLDIPIIDENELASARNSQISPLGANRRVATLEDGYLQFHPNSTITGGEIRYLTTPTKPNYSYTYNSTTRVETHDAGASTNLDWPDTVVKDIIYKALVILGVPMEDPVLMQFGQQKHLAGA
jgi:hypothetical protein